MSNRNTAHRNVTKQDSIECHKKIQHGNQYIIECNNTLQNKNVTKYTTIGMSKTNTQDKCHRTTHHKMSKQNIREMPQHITPEECHK